MPHYLPKTESNPPWSIYAVSQTIISFKTPQLGGLQIEICKPCTCINKTLTNVAKIDNF